MKVLIIGSGGREHALAWAVSASPLCELVLVAPGNPGIADLIDGRGHCIPASLDDLDGLVALARDEACDLVIIGPEAPLVDGLADKLEAAGIAVCGPRAAAAQLEGSKRFARAFCARHDIAQPQWEYFTQTAPACDFARTLGACVVKADGLAAGKGVIICDNADEAEKAIHSLLGGRFGAASAEILVEERISGPEMSAFALLDGADAVWLGSAQDHKRAFDGDKGPNTGGMGAISPSPFETDTLRAEVMENIIRPVAQGMADEGTPYRGILYAGLMLTKSGPQIIEFNCRFGDPEAQTILPRLKTDFLSALLTQAEGGLSHFDMQLLDDVAVTVVMAANGYPDAYEKGSEIRGAEDLNDGSLVFHAGTSREHNGALVSAGGRVLGITGQGPDTASAIAAAYDRVSKIDWPGGFCRRDIAGGMQQD